MKITGTILAVVLAALTGLGGYFVGKNAGEERGDHQGGQISTKSIATESSPTRGQGGGRGAVEPNLRGYELSQNPRLGLETLIEELRQSPMAQMDFEALFGIWDMIQYLDGAELSALIADLEEMGGGQEKMAVRMMLLNRWAAKDGLAAMETILSGEKGMMQMVGAMGAMMGWMRSDPEQAYRWFQENGERLGSGAMGMGKDQVEAMYLANMAKTDFQGAMAKLDGLESHRQSSVVQQLAQTAVMDKDRRAELLNYLKEKEDDSLLKTARESIVQHMAWQDPRGALSFIEDEKLPSDEREKLIERATSMWGHADPKRAVEYLAKESQGQENAGEKISDGFGQWIANDEAGAAEWLSKQPDEFQSDEVFQSAGQQLYVQGKYERAAEWYGQILDEDSRKNHYTMLYGGWSERDAEAAEQWKNSLPPEDALDSSGVGETLESIVEPAIPGE